jgi:hypothetical protein
MELLLLLMVFIGIALLGLYSMTDITPVQLSVKAFQVIKEIARGFLHSFRPLPKLSPRVLYGTEPKAK